jgi:hypothetical protein
VALAGAVSPGALSIHLIDALPCTALSGPYTFLTNLLARLYARVDPINFREARQNEGHMNPVLLIFAQIAIAGCGFLVYFLYALRRESKKLRKRPRVEIRPMPSQTCRGHVVQLYEVVTTRKVRGVASR